MDRYKREKIKQKEDNKEKHLENTMDEILLLKKETELANRGLAKQHQ
ncbi:hypothetical protein LCGC14_1314110 [marine sediment metagenome]|uniref:Uncharacterized protein n=1 Tax=marine sediment metagenome TaxID=412755 RepID=A0A0F9L6L9_9ZZZZ